MNYMLLIYQDEQAFPETSATYEEGMAACGGLVERLYESGHYVAAGILQPTAVSTSLRIRDGHRMVTDGPFAETREQLAGYMIVEADNLDEAIAIASQHPVAQWGTVEVRPLKFVPAFSSEQAVPERTVSGAEK